MPLALAVAIRLMIAAARSPAFSEPANSQFLRPRAIGRIAFSIGLLSIDQVPSARKRASARSRAATCSR
jgi:hypothetical protein